MKYFSMFSGIGGFELGIQNARLIQQKDTQGVPEPNGSVPQHDTCVGYSEIDKYAISIYQKHFGGHKNYGDATKIDPGELPEFDMLCGGFPCQAFSIAGSRRGFNDTRGTLFFEVARIIKAKRPKIVFLENVKGLLSHDQGKTFRVIIATLDELGYDVQWVLLNSKNFGVPQNRERVFIIGSLRGQCRPEILPFGGDHEEDYAQDKLCDRQQLLQRNEPCELQEESKETDSDGIRVHNLQPMNGKGIGGKGYISKEDGTTYCLDASAGIGIQEGMQIRRLTPIECARLQGFPDDWHRIKGISDTQAYKCYGNAVTVNVIQAIMEKLLRWEND